MHGFYDLIVREAAWWQLPFYVIGCLVVQHRWGMVSEDFFGGLLGPEKNGADGGKLFAAPVVKTVFSYYAWALSVPVAEEVVFRFVPIALANRYFPAHLWLTILAASLLFGAGHGISLRRTIIIGAWGLLSSILFLKCGGLEGHYLKAFLAVAVGHILFNLPSAIRGVREAKNLCQCHVAMTEQINKAESFPVLLDVVEKYDTGHFSEVDIQMFRAKAETLHCSKGEWAEILEIVSSDEGPFKEVAVKLAT